MPQRKLTALLTALLIAVTAVTPAAAAGADQEPWKTTAGKNNLYGAIAFDKRTRDYGFSFDHPTRSAAEERAVRECAGSHCQSMMWFANGCGALATDKPDSPHLLARQMRARVYVGAAGIDATFPDEQRQRLETALADAGVAYTIETYENAKHGFAVNGHLVYDREASERHWERLLQLLQDTLKTA